MPPEGFYRKKLLHATLFFAKNTKYLGKVKLAKLLHYLDFNHFKQTGYPSIGLKYKTYPFGPLPEDFWREVADGVTPPDFAGFLKLKKTNDTSNAVWFNAVRDPDMDLFSPREVEIMTLLAQKYNNHNAEMMIKDSHADDQPWAKMVERFGKNRKMNIPYKLVLDNKGDVSEKEAMERLTEFFIMLDNFDLHPAKQQG
ncbi:MAG: Panacea domain-containing protein [Candidatus Hatepunaea meridiana]|nr:Panacea domain-containing protein [Candidatus Hatepunaea meridiana]